MYDTILVPTDGSAGARAAVDHALDLAAEYGATVHVLYVVNTAALVDFDESGVDAEMLADSLEREGHKTVERVADRARESDVAAETAVRRGRPVGTILDYADEVGVDLIVMGTHGRSGLDRILLGSVTEKVVRKSEVPVLTVRRSED